MDVLQIWASAATDPEVLAAWDLLEKIDAAHDGARDHQDQEAFWEMSLKAAGLVDRARSQAFDRRIRAK